MSKQKEERELRERMLILAIQSGHPGPHVAMAEKFYDFVVNGSGKP